MRMTTSERSNKPGRSPIDRCISYCIKRGWTGRRKTVCFAFNGRRIVSIGHNSYSHSSSLQRRAALLGRNPDRLFEHAEICALRRAPRNASISLLLLVRLNKDGHPLIAKPCECCEPIIKEKGIKNVKWTG